MLTKKYLGFLILSVANIAEEKEFEELFESLGIAGGGLILLPVIILTDLFTLPLQLLSYIMKKIKKN